MGPGKGSLVTFRMQSSVVTLVHNMINEKSNKDSSYQPCQRVITP